MKVSSHSFKELQNVRFCVCRQLPHLKSPRTVTYFIAAHSQNSAWRSLDSLGMMLTELVQGLFKVNALLVLNLSLVIDCFTSANREKSILLSY